MNKNKRAELTTAQIITMVIVVIAFAIILFILYQMFSYGKIDQDACHTSVVFRGTLPAFGGAKDYVPLKCKTEKICVTGKLFGGNCPDYGSEKGISYARVNSKTEVEQLFAQNIVQCWQMMGEGKVSIFSEWVAQTYGFGAVYPSCVICNRIAFDRASLDGKVDLGQINVQAYMDTHLVPGKNYTYSDFLRGENAKTSINSALNLSGAGLGIVPVSLGDANKDLAVMASQSADKELQSREAAIMFTQISAPTQGGSAANIGKTLLAGTVGSFVLAPSSTISFGKNLGKVCSSGEGTIICAAVAIGAIVYQQANVAYNRAVTAGYCGDVSIGTDARNGCSVVRVVNYNASEIMQHCGIIESIS